MGQKWLSWMPGAQKDHTESHGLAQHRGPDGPTGCHLQAPQAEGLAPVRALQAVALCCFCVPFIFSLGASLFTPGEVYDKRVMAEGRRSCSTVCLLSHPPVWCRADLGRCPGTRRIPGAAADGAGPAPRCSHTALQVGAFMLMGAEQDVDRSGLSLPHAQPAAELSPILRRSDPAAPRPEPRAGAWGGAGSPCRPTVGLCPHGRCAQAVVCCSGCAWRSALVRGGGPSQRGQAAVRGP